MDYPFYFTWTKQKDAPSFLIDKVDGTSFILKDQSSIIDMISTNFHASFGLNNKRIKNSIKEQLDLMPISSPKGVFDLKIGETERLIKFLGLTDEGGKIFYTTGGAEAVENGLKVAREFSGRKYILARKKSYHGATLGALSVTGDWRGENHLSLSEYTIRIPEPYEDPELFVTRNIISENQSKIAAFCLETITSMNGVIIPPQSWWNGIKDLSSEFDIPIIIDEVSTGFGRTGHNFAFQKYGIKPDFVCMAKGISGGYIPFGALWTSKRVADFYSERVLNCGLTNYSHPLGLSALRGVLDHFDDESFCRHLATIEKVFHEQLDIIEKSSFVQEVRKIGMLSAIILKDKKISWEDGIKAGIHIASKENMIVLAPPLVISEEDLKEGMRRLGKLIVSIGNY